MLMPEKEKRKFILRLKVFYAQRVVTKPLENGELHDQSDAAREQALFSIVSKLPAAIYIPTKPENCTLRMHKNSFVARKFL